MDNEDKLFLLTRLSIEDKMEMALRDISKVLSADLLSGEISKHELTYVTTMLGLICAFAEAYLVDDTEEIEENNKLVEKLLGNEE